MFNLAEYLSTRDLDGPEPQPITLHRKRIYVLPNRLGLLFGLVILTMLFGSMNYNNSMGFALSFLLAGIGMVSLLHTHNNLSRLKVEVVPGEPVFAGQKAVFRIKLTTDDAARFSIVVENEHGSDTVDIGRNDISIATLKVPTDRRGYIDSGRFRIYTDYPFGIVTAWSWVELDASALVYPAPEKDPVPAEFSSDHKTSLSSTDLKQSDDFHGFRVYQPGDSPKHLFWKQFPSNGTILTKKFLGGGEAGVWLDWESVRDLPLELAVSRLCSWILECDENQVRYGLRLENKVVQAGKGESHHHECMRLLALYRLEQVHVKGSG